MTNQKKQGATALCTLAPLAGCTLFLILYIIATLYYPGGSQLDQNSKGFSWTQNYWCNLLNENAINGQPNPARPIALAAMSALCLTLTVFWYIFPRQIQFTKTGRLTIQLSGLTAMIIGMFLFTGFHDMVINVATSFGFIALTGTFVGLNKLKWKKLFWMGLFNIVLVALNNVLYFDKNLLFYLPVVQKITFLYFLLWVCLIDISLYNKINSKSLTRTDASLWNISFVTILNVIN